MPDGVTAPVGAGDPCLDEVKAELQSRPEFEKIVGKALRQAFDEVIDCPRTGRYRIEDLEKTEKTYIGTKVEIVLRQKLELARGAKLDNIIRGHEVDTKFSLTGGWMIPREAVGEICLLVQGSDKLGVFSVGVLRTRMDVLTRGQNQDKKRSVSGSGKRLISWVCRDKKLPLNFLLSLDDNTRAAILSQGSATQRLRALFRNVTGQIIPRSVIPQVAQVPGDPFKRARETKKVLGSEGFQVLCAKYQADSAEFKRHGFSGFEKDDWLSIRVGA